MTINVTYAKGGEAVTNGARITELVAALAFAYGFGEAPIRGFCLQTVTAVGEGEEEKFTLHHVHGVNDEKLANTDSPQSEPNDEEVHRLVLELIRVMGGDLDTAEQSGIRLGIHQTDGNGSIAYTVSKENGEFTFRNVSPGPQLAVVFGSFGGAFPLH